MKSLTLVLYAGFPNESVTLGWFSFRLSVSEEALEGDSSSLTPLSISAFICDLTERTLSLISHSRETPSSWPCSWERHMTVIHLSHISLITMHSNITCAAKIVTAQTSTTNTFICNRSITVNRCGVLQCCFLYHVFEAEQLLGNCAELFLQRSGLFMVFLSSFFHSQQVPLEPHTLLKQAQVSLTAINYNKTYCRSWLKTL